MDCSWWLVSIYLVFPPFALFLILLPGDEKENKYGAPSPSPKIGITLLNILTIAFLGYVCLGFCYWVNDIAKDKSEKCHGYKYAYQIRLPDLSYNTISNPVLAKAMWDTADNEHKMVINSYQGGLNQYDIYVPSLDLIIKTNIKDSKEIQKYILSNEATDQEDRNYIFYSAAYATNQLITYSGPKDNLMTVIKDIINQVIKGIKSIFIRKTSKNITVLDELISKISSADMDTETKLALLADSDSKYAWNTLSEEKQQEILKSAYVKYMGNIEEEFENNCKHNGKIIQVCVRLWKKAVPSEKHLKQIEMFKQLIKEPLETVYNPDWDSVTNIDNQENEIPEVNIEQAVKELKESNKFVKLMLELHPEILREFINLIKDPDICEKWEKAGIIAKQIPNETVTSTKELDESSLETTDKNIDGIHYTNKNCSDNKCSSSRKSAQMNSYEKLKSKGLTAEDIASKIPLIDKKFNEYVRKAPDKELYDVYYTDYKRMKKNGCMLYVPAPEDVKEASEVKYNLVVAARKKPQLYKPISQQEKEKIITKIVKIHRDKKYNLQNFQLMASGQTNSLSDAEKCQTEINFWDSIFSLPKKESLIMIREMAYSKK